MGWGTGRVLKMNFGAVEVEGMLNERTAWLSGGATLVMKILEAPALVEARGTPVGV